MALYALEPHEARTASSIMRWTARTYNEDGNVEAAHDCLVAALAIAEAFGDTQARAEATNHMGTTEVLRGDLEAGDALYARALRLALETGDEKLQAMIAQNRGNIAGMRGDAATAIEHFVTSLAVFRKLGLRDALGPLLNNLGLVFTQLGQLDEAQAVYDEALIACGIANDVPHRILTLINSTDVLLARGDLAHASELCKTVLYEATLASDERALGETYKHMGMIARRELRHADATRFYELALSSATRRNDLLLAAEVSYEQAELHELAGNSRATLQALSHSYKLYDKLRLQRSLADVQRRVTRLEKRFHESVNRWAESIESADPYTMGHCERVADYACALALDIGFDDITLFWFRVGALLHDVGKIKVPNEILNKPGKLTDEERAIMETHAAAGAEMLRDIDFPWDILPLVRGHHERWDGRGYPDKLRGEAIDLSARIVCVADVFDALTSDRPYRKAFSSEKALAIMTEDSGKLFDPELFARFLRLFETGRLAVRPTELAASA
jgi:putative nucleotidyltransferase with HDIG domain